MVRRKDPQRRLEFVEAADDRVVTVVQHLLQAEIPPNSFQGDPGHWRHGGVEQALNR